MERRVIDRLTRLLIALVGGVLLATAVWAIGGDLLWQDRVDKAAASDGAFAIAVQGARVFAAGFVAADGSCNRSDVIGNCDYSVRAYEAKTGHLLWEDQVDKAEGFDLALAVAVRGGRVFAAGWVDADGSCIPLAEAGNCDFFVRAYEAKTGHLLWEDQFDGAGDHDLAGTIAAGGGQVFAGGVVTNAAGDGDWLVRAYEAKTGILLWQDQFDKAGGTDEVLSIAVREGRVFTAGCARNAAGNFDYIVRTYDAKNGTLLWQDQLDIAGGFGI